MEDDTLPAADGDALLYDYMKHLTSICLLALGGVLALAEKVQGKSARSVVVAASVIAMAAFCSFIASGMIVETSMFIGMPRPCCFQWDWACSSIFSQSRAAADRPRFRWPNVGR
jgi:hypothetical protein